ncbi:hypothetical protein [Brevundimonas sp.]|uniref:hypothetical protein n=1 Tax=Brevundimonas sp. TaxID=1871086 RepID=UPI0028AD42B2|nr:hypothetical protein [Brevundimonas sp.]
MAAFKTINRIAAIGAAASCAAFLGLIAVFSDQPPLLATAWKMGIATDDGFHIVRLFLVITSILAFIFRGRVAAIDYGLAVILVAAPICWLALELLYRFGGGRRRRVLGLLRAADDVRMASSALAGGLRSYAFDRLSWPLDGHFAEVVETDFAPT